jgi:hypothetical protein
VVIFGERRVEGGTEGLRAAMFCFYNLCDIYKTMMVKIHGVVCLLFVYFISVKFNLKLRKYIPKYERIPALR